MGRMLTEAAHKLGYKVIVIDPIENCPAAQAGAEQIVATYNDREATLAMSKKSDYMTIEIEHIDTTALTKVENSGAVVNPSSKAIELIKDKLGQKKVLQKAGLPVGEFSELTNKNRAESLINEYNGEIIIKSRYNAFDGRGNTVMTTPDQLFDALGKNFYAEKIVPFKLELAVVFARDTQGNIEVFPVAQTIHKRNICVEVDIPAAISQEVKHEALDVTHKTAELLTGAGVFAVEMFLAQDDQILINEIAPRVHNSGHYTMDACETSQFEQHVRAVTGMELSSTKMKVPAAVMVNILGERDGPVELNGVEEAEKIDGVSVYIYGKSPTKIDRKMGHINAIGDTIEAAREKALKARRMISI